MCVYKCETYEQIMLTPVTCIYTSVCVHPCKNGDSKHIHAWKRMRMRICACLMLYADIKECMCREDSYRIHSGMACSCITTATSRDFVSHGRVGVYM